MYHSEQRQIQAARKKRPDPLVTLHPDTAKALDLTEGEWVKVESVQGSIRMRLRFSDTVDLRMADVDHGWWFPERSEEEPELFGVFESNALALFGVALSGDKGRLRQIMAHQEIIQNPESQYEK
jgi:anaerobic selenocysteine-containing dehydrogenase